MVQGFFCEGLLRVFCIVCCEFAWNRLLCKWCCFWFPCTFLSTSWHESTDYASMPHVNEHARNNMRSLAPSNEHECTEASCQFNHSVRFTSNNYVIQIYCSAILTADSDHMRTDDSTSWAKQARISASPMITWVASKQIQTKALKHRRGSCDVWWGSGIKIWPSFISSHLLRSKMRIWGWKATSRCLQQLLLSFDGFGAFENLLLNFVRIISTLDVRWQPAKCWVKCWLNNRFSLFGQLFYLLHMPGSYFKKYVHMWYFCIHNLSF